MSVLLKAFLGIFLLAGTGLTPKTVQKETFFRPIDVYFESKSLGKDQNGCDIFLWLTVRITIDDNTGQITNMQVIESGRLRKCPGVTRGFNAFSLSYNEQFEVTGIITGDTGDAAFDRLLNDPDVKADVLSDLNALLDTYR